MNEYRTGNVKELNRMAIHNPKILITNIIVLK